MFHAEDQRSSAVPGEKESIYVLLSAAATQKCIQVTTLPFFLLCAFIIVRFDGGWEF